MKKADFGIEQNWAIWARLSKKFPYGGFKIGNRADSLVVGPVCFPQPFIIPHFSSFVNRFSKKIFIKIQKNPKAATFGFLYRQMNIYTAPKELGSSSSM